MLGFTDCVFRGLRVKQYGLTAAMGNKAWDEPEVSDACERRAVVSLLLVISFRTLNEDTDWCNVSASFWFWTSSLDLEGIACLDLMF